MNIKLQNEYEYQTSYEHLVLLWNKQNPSFKLSLLEKCPNKEFFLARIFLYFVKIQENMDQEKLLTWTLFTQCPFSNKRHSTKRKN